MRCHYEVLEISTNADDSDIKSAYRKLALKWHPDKNLDNSELAKEQFQIVQQAYEVLSDRQERAWYDAHRDQILRGRNSEFEDKSLDVFQYFTTTCFKGYEDDVDGFYSVYRTVFDQIAKEDIEFMDEKEELCEIPSFGKSDGTYENVQAFYKYWMSYFTKKSYSWLDPHDIREGKGDRRLLKIIEKENKKVRLKARKDRNEEVRNLVAFVRKRDKRVQAYKKEFEAKTLENRKKQEVLSRQKRLEHKKLHDPAQQADWLKFDNVQSELEEIEKHLAKEFGDNLSISEEEDINNLYCVACNKVFKTPKAFENHELSKKHRENVEILKQSMLDEEESNASDDLEEYNDIDDHNENLENTFDENGEISGEESIADEEDLPEIGCNKKSKKQKRKNRKNNQQRTDNNLGLSDDDLVEDIGQKDLDKVGVEENNESTEESEEIISKKSKKKNNKTRNVSVDKNGLGDETSKDFCITQFSDDDFDFGTNKNQRKKNKKGGINKTKPNVNNVNVSDQEESSTVDIDNKEESSAYNIVEGKKSKKTAKKDKKVNKKDTPITDLNDIDTSHCCVTCKGDFPSKNKLFEHLKKTGHGVYIPPKVKETNRRSKSVKN